MTLWLYLTEAQKGTVDIQHTVPQTQLSYSVAIVFPADSFKQLSENVIQSSSFAAC